MWSNFTNATNNTLPTPLKPTKKSRNDSPQIKAFKKAIAQKAPKEIEKAAQGLSTDEILTVMSKRNALREDLAVSIVREGDDETILPVILKALKKTLTIRNDRVYAQQIWNAFEQRTQSLTGNKAAIRQRHYQKVSKIKPITRIREKAAQKIVQFWRRARSSFKSIPVNNNGNHGNSFFHLSK